MLHHSLIAMLLWSEGSEGTFWSSSQTAHMSTTTGGGFTLTLFNAERQAEKL